MTATPFPILASLVAPYAVDTFLDDYWPRRTFVAHGSPARLPALMRDKMLSTPAELAKSYRGRLLFTHGHSQRMVQLNDATAMAPFDMGLTLHYVDMDQCLPGAAAFARQLEGELGLHEGTVRISVFNSPRDDGLPCHYDPTELISIQLHGTKEFKYAPVQEIRDPCGNQFVPMGPVFDDLYAQATHGFPEPATANFERVRMEPGSVLFLPRGTWHHTVASADSLSISIMINVAPAMIPLLEQLGQLLLQDSAWRRPFFGRCGTRGHDRDACDQAARLLAALPATIAPLSRKIWSRLPPARSAVCSGSASRAGSRGLRTDGCSSKMKWRMACR